MDQLSQPQHRQGTVDPRRRNSLHTTCYRGRTQVVLDLTATQRDQERAQRQKSLPQAIKKPFEMQRLLRQELNRQRPTNPEIPLAKVSLSAVQKIRKVKGKHQRGSKRRIQRAITQPLQQDF